MDTRSKHHISDIILISHLASGYVADFISHSQLAEIQECLFMTIPAILY